MTGFVLLTVLHIIISVYAAILAVYLHRKGDTVFAVGVLLLGALNFMASSLPALYNIITNQLRESYVIYLNTWTKGLAVEAIRVGLALVTFNFIILLKRNNNNEYQTLSISDYSVSDYRVLLFIVLTAIILHIIIQPFSTSSFESAEYGIFGERLATQFTSLTARLGVTLSIFSGFIQPGLALLFILAWRKRNWTAVLLFSILLFYFIFPHILLGSRSALITPIIIFSFIAFETGKIRRFWTTALVSITLLIIFSAWFVDYRSSPGATYTNRTIYERLEAIYESAVNRTFSRGTESIFSSLDDFTYRTNTTLLAGYFVDDANLKGFTGKQAYYNSIFFFVPRLVWPEKPVPGSIDGSLLTIPDRYIVYLIGGNSINNEAGVGMGGVAYWHFGWIGVIFAGIIQGIALYVLIILTRRFPALIGFMLFWNAMRPPAFSFFFASPNLLIMYFVNNVLIGIILVYGFTLLTRYFGNSRQRQLDGSNS